MPLTKSKKIGASTNLPPNGGYLRKTNTTPIETGVPTTPPPSKTVRYAAFATGWLGRPSDTKCGRGCHNPPNKAAAQLRTFEENKAAVERYQARWIADREARWADAAEKEGAEYLLKEVNYYEDSVFVEELS